MTDYNSIVRIGLKLSGVGLVVYGALSLSSTLPHLFQVRNWEEWEAAIILSNMVVLAMPFFFGVFLWLFPATVANTVVRFGSLTRKSKTDLSYELERVGISLLGLYLFYRTVSFIAYQVVMYRAKAEALGSARALDDLPAIITTAIVQLVLALLFMLQSRGIVSLLRKARGH